MGGGGGDWAAAAPELTWPAKSKFLSFSILVLNLYVF